MRSWKAPGPVGVSLAVALALTALAEDARAEEVEQPQESHQHRSRDILDRIDNPRPEPSWFDTHVSFQRKGGLQYNDSFRMGDRQFGFTVRGPVRGRLNRKELGLTFEIRF